MTIYCLIDPRTDCIRYIGQTTDVAERFANQISEAKRLHTRRANWIRGLLKLGLMPRMEILEVVAIEQVDDVERFWIASLRAAGAILLNVTDGGDKRTGLISPEGRERMRQGALKRWARAGERQAQSTRATKRMEDPNQRQHLSQVLKGRLCR